MDDPYNLQWAIPQGHRGVHTDKATASRAPSAPTSLEKPPDLDPFFDDLTRAKSAKELKEHLEPRVL